MKRLMLIGRSGAGKTTLVQCIKALPLEYSKTQVIQYSEEFIDLPGEYLENRGLYRAIIVTAAEADAIGLVVDAANEDNWFPEGFATMFAKPVIGIVTKADKVDANVKRAIGFVEQAGAQKVIVTSAYQNEGVATLLDWLDDTKGGVHDDAYL